MEEWQHKQVHPIEKWHELVHPIYSYNPEAEVRPENVRLSNNLSPLTNFVLNVFVHTIGKKNLIVAVPDNVLRIIPVISYLYSHREKKSVIIFTQENSGHIRDKVALNHNRNYHLLNKGPEIQQGGKYLFEEIPIGYLSEDTVEAKVYIPRGPKSWRRRYIQTQEENFLDGHGPKILLSYNEGKIIDTIENIALDDRKLSNLNVKIDLGLILFENVDRFVYSEYSCQLFLRWISDLLDRGTRFLFHFSNTESKFIQSIKSEIETLVIPFGPNLLRSNYLLRNEAEGYFRSKRDPVEWNFLIKYNIDSIDLYKREKCIEISKPLLDIGNIDYHFEMARILLREINEERLVNKRLHYVLKRVLFSLQNIIINPSKCREKYGDEVVPWRSYTIPQLIQIARSRLSEEDRKNRVVLDQILAEIFCIFLELKECRRYNENYTYSRIAKDYRILEEILNTQDNKNVIIATNSARERNILEEELEKCEIIRDIRILTIKQINSSLFQRSNATIILPGPLRMEYLSELIRPYRRVLFLSYEGKNYSWIRDQIELSYGHSLKKCEIHSKCLMEIYDFLNLPRDGLFTEFHHERKDNEMENNRIDTRWEVREKNEGNMIISETLREIITVESRYKQYREYEEEMTHTENAIRALEKEEIKKDFREGSYYGISLRKLNSNYTTNMLLPIEKTYFYLKRIGVEVEEGTPRNLRPGYIIVILDNDEKKTSLEIMLEIFDLEESVDKDLITYWKERLAEFIETYNLTYAEFYKLYEEKGGERSYQTVMNWAKGNILGPEDPNDLLIIGRILGDEYIIEDFRIINREVRYLRVIHQNTGRMLRRIIRQIITGKLDPSKLSYDEYRLYEKIEDGLYEIISIVK